MASSLFILKLYIADIEFGKVYTMRGFRKYTAVLLGLFEYLNPFELHNKEPGYRIE